MAAGPLVREQIDAGAELVRRFEDHAPMAAAFWLKREEESRWLLILASDQIDDSSFHLGYAEIVRLSREIHDPHLDMFSVRRIALSHRRYPERAMNLGPRMLGHESVEGIYVYPIAVPAP